MIEDAGTSLDELLGRLSVIARKGPLRAVTSGATGVGVTLLRELGIENTSNRKSSFKGIVVTARRASTPTTMNRVNLFAQVPDWSISSCKSSREIVESYGYDSENGRRLYCTVSSLHPNSQGLILKLNRREGLLQELFVQDVESILVASWQLSRLRERLRDSHPASVWVLAAPSRRDGIEYFHYRECLYTGPALADELAPLVDAGTVTVDHLIETRNGKTSEKGPLFKIKPSNFDLLFPPPVKYNLLT